MKSSARMEGVYAFLSFAIVTIFCIMVSFLAILFLDGRIKPGREWIGLVFILPWAYGMWLHLHSVELLIERAVHYDENEFMFSPAQKEQILLANRYIESSAPKAAAIRFRRAFPTIFMEK